ncbi:MAG TPA: hypothetical protein VGB24_09170 [Longimicrobium sp.]|jgi:hypothetical protein|uniref:hypothetical protein n=1 Tax=Longimicrobium sp. TaxID=2029185 RepID=UPI002ED84A9B
MKRSVAILSLACALAACGNDNPAARLGSEGRAPAENAPKLTSEPGTGSPAPRTINIHPNHPTYQVVLHEREGGIVDSIHVRRGSRHVQTLKPSPNGGTAGLGADRVSTPDLDFDGHADLALVTELAAGTSRSHYWRFETATGRYESLGNRETLQVDTAAEALTTFNRGGHGGRIWTAARIGVVDGALVPVRSEEQAWLQDAQAYIYIVRERRGSRLAEVSRDTLAESELRAGPSWHNDDQQD